ncbi:hypothetical protein ES705_27263 [subsurface metagenome]
MVFFGFLTLSAGMVADSKPVNAQKVNAAVVVIAVKLETLLKLKGLKFSTLNEKKPKATIANKGRTLRMVVISCT